MGGWGSGRGSHGRDTTSDMQALDVRRLQRNGLLTPGLFLSGQLSRNSGAVTSFQIRTEPNRVILKYRSRNKGDEWRQMEYPVNLEWTGCNLGGKRAWFLCPVPACGRRVAILYSGSIFACRHCHNLAYECQRETDGDRAMRRADTIRRRLGWAACILNLPGGKPKGMHWKTYRRLTVEHDAFVGISLTGMAERQGLIEQRLEVIRRNLHGKG